MIHYSILNRYFNMKKSATTLFVLLIVIFALSKSYAQDVVVITVRTAPPELPDYDQPECPIDGYLWVPGYWSYNDTEGYYWVPGVWTAPPNSGLLWTPAYWGYDGGVYGFHAGYWGATVGFYGGVNYGYGYSGDGYYGGAWSGSVFRYNTAVVRVNTVVIHNTYEDRTVIREDNHMHTSFNGPGGIDRHPNEREMTAMRDKHFESTAEQRSHEDVASHDRNQLARVNGGHPAHAAMDKVGGRDNAGVNHNLNNNRMDVGRNDASTHMPNENNRNSSAGNANDRNGNNNNRSNGNTDNRTGSNNGNRESNAANNRGAGTSGGRTSGTGNGSLNRTPAMGSHAMGTRTTSASKPAPKASASSIKKK
jgi:hypothetical protein